MLRIRKRRLKNYKRRADETGANIKWRPVHESVLDDISRSDTKRDFETDVQPDYLFIIANFKRDGSILRK